METVDADQNRSESVDVCRIEIVPDLSVPVDGSATIDVDIVTSKLEECGHVLKAESEGVCLPVHGVVCKLDVRLDICRTR